jgi:hypothetical protein
MSIYTTDRYGNEVLTTKNPMHMLIGSVFEGGRNRLEKAIRNTYTKEDAEQIVKLLNQGLEAMAQE